MSIKIKRKGLRIREKFSDALKIIVILLILVWFFRETLNISQYSFYIILFASLLFLLSSIITLELKGFIITISNLFGKLAYVSFILALTYFILGFFGLEAFFVNLSLPLFISAILLGIISYIIYKYTLREIKLKINKKPILLKPTTVNISNFITLNLTNETKVFKVERVKEEVGGILFNEIQVNIKHPLKNFTLSFKPPVLLYYRNIKFKGEKVKENLKESMVIQANELLEKALRTFPRIVPKIRGVKLPFISVEEDEFGERVKIGPLTAVEDEYGERVSIGPFLNIVESKSYRYPPGFMIFSNEKRMIAREGNLIIEWDDEYLVLNRNRIKIKLGDYLAGIKETSYFMKWMENYIVKVSPNKLYLKTPEIYLSVSKSNIRLISPQKTYRLYDTEIANNIINEAFNEISKQIIDMFDGLPPDFPLIVDKITKVLERK